MMKKLLFIRALICVLNKTAFFLFFLAGFLSFFASTSPVSAATAPTNTPTPTPTTQQAAPTRKPHTSIANCDVCGYCNGEAPPGRWEACRNCVYPGAGKVAATENKTLINIPTPDPQFYFTDLGCISTRPEAFASKMSDFFFKIVGGIAFLFFLYGAGIIATSRANPEKLNYGKRIVYGAIIGLLFSLFAIFILRFIATGLGLPGIQP